MGRDGHAYKQAKLCCQRDCDTCGKRSPSGRGSWCKDCFYKQQRESEDNLFNKAEKVEWEDYACEWIYDHNHEYMNIDTFMDRYAESEEEIPTWVYGCTPETLTMRADRIIEQALEDHHEDAAAAMPEGHEKRLQKYLDLWCRKANVLSYCVDYGTVVMLPDSLIKEIEAARKEFA